MNYYRILLRLSGSLMHEVRKARVPAPEVMLLNEIHGGGAVVELAPALLEPVDTDFSPAKHRALRSRMDREYAKYGEIINGLFGSAKGGLLPTEVTLADLAPKIDEPADEDILDPPALKKAPEPTFDDPKDAIKQSLRALDWPIPVGNVSEKRLREELAQAQEAFNRKHNIGFDEEQPDVLAG